MVRVHEKTVGIAGASAFAALHAGLAFALGLAGTASGCAEPEAGAEAPSPDDLGGGKVDGETFRVRGTLRYGEPVQGRLYGTRTFDGWTFEALEGARLSVVVAPAQGRAIAVYGPEDRGGRWGRVPLGVGSDGATGELVVPEDGRYVVVVGSRRSGYELRLECHAGCEQDENAGRLLLNEVDGPALAAAGLDAEELLAYRERYGLAESLDEVGLAGRDDAISPALHRVFFSPRVGDAYGFSPQAAEHRAFVRRADAPEVDWVAGDVASPVVDLFRRAEREIAVAMYGMSLATDEGQALLDAARRGIRVRVYLDVSERDPDGRPYTESTIVALLGTPNVEVRVPRYSSRMMHEKFGIVDGVHAFDGSANVSRKAKEVYTEDRFVFMSSPAAVAALQDEWDRLWDALGKDARTLLR